MSARKSDESACSWVRRSRLHGYTLGDWADEWETYAQRAVKGDWEKSGKETFGRRRGGLTPETPVRDCRRSRSQTRLTFRKLE
jgi:hypothetical protein